MNRPDLALLIALISSIFSRFGFCYDESPWQPSYDYYHIDLGELGGHHGGLEIKVPVPKEVMVDVINGLGIKLLAIHNEHNENNIAISPYGALSVLAALSEGLQGDAVHEILQAAHIPKDKHVIRVGLRDIHRHLKSYFIPEEGFLAGLTLNLNNVTLRGEYEDVLRFYGFDYDSFNNALYPEPFTTQKPSQGTTLGTSLGVTEATSIMTTQNVENATIVLTDTRFGAATTEIVNTESTTGKEATTTLLTTTRGRDVTTPGNEEEVTTVDATAAITTVPSTTLKSTTASTITETTTQGSTITVPETTTAKEFLQTSGTSAEKTTETVSTTIQQGSTTEIPATTQDEPKRTTLEPPTERVSISTKISKVTTKISQSTYEFSEYSTDLLETSTAILTTEKSVETTETPTSTVKSITTEKVTMIPKEVLNTSIKEITTVPTETPHSTVKDITTDKVDIILTEVQSTSVKETTTDKVATIPTDMSSSTEKNTEIPTEISASPTKLVLSENETTSMKSQTNTAETVTAAPTTVTSETPITTQKTGDIQRTTREISVNMMPSDQLPTLAVEKTTFSTETMAMPDLILSNDITTASADASTQISQEISTVPPVEEDTTVRSADPTAPFGGTNVQNDFNTPTNEPTEFFEQPQDVETTTPFFFETTPTLQDMTTFNEDNFDYNYNYDINMPLNNTAEDQVPPIYEDNMANFVNNNLMDDVPNGASFNRNIKRRVRSVVDYVIARYYDDHHPYIAPPPRPAYATQQEPPQRPQYIPQPEPPRPQYKPQQEPLTFAVYGKYRESGINFMKYDTVLPFFFVPNLNALALSFPLDSTKYYLLLLLPVEDNGVDQLICDLRLNGNLRYIIEHLRLTHVIATIPSFTLKGYVTLTPLLQRLGIRRIFEPRQADFSPMTNVSDIYVTNIEQAVTVTIRNYLDPSAQHYKNFRQYSPVHFKADHPFLYFVIDSDLHVALMVGKVINPLNSRIR